MLSIGSSVPDSIATFGFAIFIFFANSTTLFNICIFTSTLGETFNAPSVINKGLEFFGVVMCHI